jgi:60 kDa SS-A/Ro ribonucleoprotein
MEGVRAMANKSLFQSLRGALLPPADAVNREAAPAFAYTPKHKLAQLAMTGTLSANFYAEAPEQLADVLAASRAVEPGFLARTAVYARRRGYMKDVPALLVALLSVAGKDEFAWAFPRVIDNGRMLRNFVQIMRSGAVGRKSLGSRPKRLVANWLASASDLEIMRASVGQDPSLADVIKMVHPKPADPGREALYGYLIGKPHDASLLPAVVGAFERFKQDPSAPVPDVPFQMLTALDLTPQHWAAIAEQAGWHMVRMNLNTFARHGVFKVEGFTSMVAERLKDAQAIRRAKVFPYQLMAAHAAAGKDVPEPVREALHDAMEMAIFNVPAVPGRVAVCPDVSGSMRSSLTGVRRGATSAIRCVDVVALVAAAFVRRSPEVLVLPFAERVVDVRLERQDTVLTNAQRLAAVGGGGTNCSAPLQRLNADRAAVDLVVFVSDNQSWMDAGRGGHGGTAMMQEWAKLRARNPAAKLVCIDLQPYGTTQAAERPYILNVGGFSDAVFGVIAAFANGELGAGHWVEEIERMEW